MFIRCPETTLRQLPKNEWRSVLKRPSASATKTPRAKRSGGTNDVWSLQFELCQTSGATAPHPRQARARIWGLFLKKTQPCHKPFLRHTLILYHLAGKFSGLI